MDLGPSGHIAAGKFWDANRALAAVPFGLGVIFNQVLEWNASDICHAVVLEWLDLQSIDWEFRGASRNLGKHVQHKRYAQHKGKAGGNGASCCASAANLLVAFSG